MSTIATVNAAELQTWTEERLKAELVKGLQLTADSLLRLAAIWSELTRRGVDLSEHIAGIGRTIALIAGGHLAAEAVVAFIGRPGILHHLQGLPLDRQRELASGAKIEIYDPDQRAPITTSLMTIPYNAIRHVIREGREIPLAEQKVYYSTRRKPSKSDQKRTYRVVVDRESRTVRVGNVSVPLTEVISALAMAAGHEGVINPDQHTMDSGATAIARLTPEEKERLKAASKAHDIPEWEMVRQAVLAMWLL